MFDSSIQAVLAAQLPLGLPQDPLPPKKPRMADYRSPDVPHAPKRTPNLSAADTKLALQNALRYFDPKHHAELATEFLEELREFGHIYMYRFMPTEYEIRSYPISWYPAAHPHAAALAVMIMNVLDKSVAMFPQELITYGGNGSVLSNWGQYRLVMKYLCLLNDTQTLVLYSGHPAGLFPSTPQAPRSIITNGMMVPNYSSREMYDKLYAIGVTQYGQMTAGSFCYIGPQGIVHGTTITVRSAGQKYLGTSDLGGRVLVTSGLGGMSGAQAKAGKICGVVTIIAEVDPAALYKRHKQQWLDEVTTTLDACIARMKLARRNKEGVSIGYLGNVVDLWERLVAESEGAAGELLVDLGSDQTSCHNPFGGGYYPVQVSFEEGKKILETDPPRFKQLVQETLRRHVAALNKLADKGMKFWDYGNSFLLEAARAGADVGLPGKPLPKDGEATKTAENRFRYPSYVQDIMGDVFSLGFGPFRWVCTSCNAADLDKTDKIAEEVLVQLLESKKLPEASAEQVRHNLLWIRHAKANNLVVGSQARILYADCEGRREISRRFNEAVKSGAVSAPIVLSRDHHDVSGTDSPFRETSDVADGSAFCADMSVHNVIGDAARGATWVALHNGGGVGWGEVMNGGFGLVLDGTEEAGRKAKDMLGWDVLNGVARRAWAGNDCGLTAIERAMAEDKNLIVTVPNKMDPAVAEKALAAMK